MNRPDNAFRIFRRYLHLVADGMQRLMSTEGSREDGKTGQQLVALRSPLDFSATVERVAQSIEAAGLTIFARIDHAAGARSVGLSMPPTVVLVYGAAKGGTPIMQEFPNVALDLPLRVLLRETADGVTEAVFRPIEAMLRESGVPDEFAARLNGAQALIGKALEQ